MKTYKELKDEVFLARKKLDKLKKHKFDLILNGTKILFEILETDFQWVLQDFKTFYPDQTIQVAEKEGWVLNKQGSIPV